MSIPGVEAELDLPTTSIVLLSVDGVACTDIYLYPPTRLPARKCAGKAHRPGDVVRRYKLRAGMRGMICHTKSRDEQECQWARVWLSSSRLGRPPKLELEKAASYRKAGEKLMLFSHWPQAHDKALRLPPHQSSLVLFCGSGGPA
jgi:hypothetical protein